MKIAVLGAGGTGGYYGGLLARRAHDVTFIARGEHLRAIQERGLQVRSYFGDFEIAPARATSDPTEIGHVDLLLFCTKTYDLDEAARQARGVVGPKTVVLSLQNGVDAADRVGALLGMDHVIAGATWLSSAVEAPGIIKQASDFRRIVIGELKGGITSRVQAVQEAFEGTGVTMEISADILSVLWTKFVFISAVSAFGSLTRLPAAEYRSVPETRSLMKALMQETSQLAGACGVKVAADVVEKTMAFADTLGPTIKASMQLDVAAGRRSEIESIIGVIGRKGREVGLATPLADMIYASLLPIDLKARRSVSAN